MEIALGIPENVINNIHKGMKAEVSFASITDTFKAEVTEASPALDLSTSTYPIRVTILEPSDKIKSGMAANVAFNLNKTDAGISYLFAPITSIGEDRNGNFVFLLEEKNNKVIVKKQNVKIGKLRPEGFEVISGLKEGQKVATAGLQTLLNGQEVKFQ
jgi:membrane fusion protein, multidrug efflux system